VARSACHEIPVEPNPGINLFYALYARSFSLMPYGWVRGDLFFWQPEYVDHWLSKIAFISLFSEYFVNLLVETKFRLVFRRIDFSGKHVKTTKNENK